MATTAAEVRPLTERPPTAAAAGDSPAPVHASTASKRPLPHAPSALPPAKKPKTRTQYTHLRDALAKANPGLKGPELTALVREASAYAKSAAKSAARAAAGSREEQWLALWAEAATSADADLKAVKAFEVEHASTLARALRERLGAAIQQAADEKSLFGALEAAIAACARALDPATPEAERVDVSVLASVPADRTTSAKDLGAELKNELQTACSVLDEIKRECAAGELRAVLRTLGAADGDARTSLDEALCAADELRARYGKLLTKAGADATGVVELAKLVDELDAEAARVSDMRDALGLSTAGRATLVAHARSVRELRKELAETRAKLAVAQKFMDEENAKRDALKRAKEEAEARERASWPGLAEQVKPTIKRLFEAQMVYSKGLRWGTDTVRAEVDGVCPGVFALAFPAAGGSTQCSFPVSELGIKNKSMRYGGHMAFVGDVTVTLRGTTVNAVGRYSAFSSSDLDPRTPAAAFAALAKMGPW